MPRIRRFLIVALVIGGLSLTYLVDAQQPAPSQPRAPQTPPSARTAQGEPEGEAAFPSIPSYYLLSMPQVQNELKLTDKQQQQIEQFTQNYTQESQRELQTLRDVPPQQRQARVAEAQQRAVKRLETLRQRLEGVLQAEQRTELEQIAFRMAVPDALGNPQILEKLQVTEQQKQQLEQVRQQTQQKLWQLEQNMAQESLQVLTPQQQKSLRTMRDQGS